MTTMTSQTNEMPIHRMNDLNLQGEEAQKYQILFLEDDMSWRAMVQRILVKAYGSRINLNCVSSYEQADKLVSQQHYDLVICDQMLAGPETGLDLWRSLRQHKNQVPMVMLSSITPLEFVNETWAERNLPVFLEKRNMIAELQTTLDAFVPEVVWDAPTRTDSQKKGWSLFSQPRTTQLAAAFALALIPAYEMSSFSTPVQFPRIQLEQPATGTLNDTNFRFLSPELRTQVKQVVERANELEKMPSSKF